jgi:hypothetical protein
MATPAGDGRIGDATIVINANTSPARLALLGLTRDANGRLRDIRGRFVSESRLINNALGDVTRGSDRFKEAIGGLRSAALLLSPALIPIAVQAAPIAASVGAATIAVGAFGAAIAGQIIAINEAVDAEKKYKDAVDEHGATSKEAAEAQNAYVRQIQKMPDATRVTAAALSSLKDQYQDWSDSLASSTMPVATKALQMFGSVFPKLTPLVKGASGQLDRFVTIVAGGIQSPGFDRFMQSFSEFATGALKRANDGLVRLVRTMDTGKASGGMSEFMQYVKENGPLVGDTLKNVATALTKLLVAASDVGVGLLTVINAFADLVAALPTGLITTLLQVAIAFKAVKIAAAGFSAISAGILAVTTQITAMRTAAAGATTRVAALSLAFRALSVTAKIAVASTGIGLLFVALMQLSQLGQRAAPDVDRMTTALGEFGRSGKVAGELARTFGRDLDGLGESLRVIARPSTTQSIERSVSAFLGYGKGGPEAKKAAEALDAVDKSLANLVSGGKADLATAAFDRVKASLADQGFTAAEITKEMGDYRQAMADAAFEQKVAADAMGLFGAQAQATSAKLAAQKQSADGLRQSIQALNDINRQALGGMIAFEASIDTAAKAAQDNAGSLRMVNGQLDLNSPKAQAAASALNDLAAKTDENTAAARTNFASWETVNGIYQRGRGELIKSAQQMGLTEVQAKKLADQILDTPDKTAFLKGDLTDLKAKLGDAKTRLATVPDSRKAAVRAEISQLTAAIARAQRELAALKDKNVRLTITERRIIETSRRNVGPTGQFAHGGIIGRAQNGLYIPGYAPGRDTELILASKGEGVLIPETVRRIAASMGTGPKAAIDALNRWGRSGHLGAARRAQQPGPARGGTPAAAPLDVGSMRAGSGPGTTVVTNVFHLTNAGLISSERDLQNWLAGALDKLRLQGRLPGAA